MAPKVRSQSGKKGFNKNKTKLQKPASYYKNGNHNKVKVFKDRPKQGQLEDKEIEYLKTQYSAIRPSNITSFTDIPLSKKTLNGLKDCEYKVPTDIQKESIGWALQGNDILGAAVTGSGKTLAFLIPVMENLFLKKWTRMDGPGCIIITPTRELAYQIFETLKKVGKHHDFSAALIIGGKNLKYERKRMDQCNIIICTPGRLLQHMDENPLFNTTSVQVLVLDEADRCLDLGFQTTIDAIIENIPSERQTLLFSATQTKSVKDLARLSLNSPVYVAPHEQQMTTPDLLQQNYVLVAQEDKVAMIWSFIKSHLKQKSVIFMSSCKQVKYVYEIFCRLRPGTSLLALYGTLDQHRRMAIYDEFSRKSNAVLFATDIASRGLDFPVVNWVVQLDCPEDATAYIHRAGRTARNQKGGESLLVLTPNEEAGMIAELEASKIKINKIAIDPKRLFSPRVKMEAFVASSKDLKDSCQRAFVAYFKSVFLMKNKTIFNVESIDSDAYARSLGLAVTPRVRFLERLKKKKKLQMKGGVNESSAESSGEEDDAVQNPETTDKKALTTFKFGGDDESDSDSDASSSSLLRVKRRNHEVDGLPEMPPLEDQKSAGIKERPVTKASVAKKINKKRIVANQKVVFDEEGNQVVDTAKELQSEMAKEYIDNGDGGIDIERAKALLKEEDKFDKERFKQLVKAKHKKEKKKRKDKDEELVDDFGSEGDDDDLPDLSWLPDPNKIYKNGSDEEEDDHSSFENVSDDESNNQIHKPPKKKFKSSKPQFRQVVNSSDSSGSAEESDLEPEQVRKTKYRIKKMTSKMSVNETEALAMRLLGGN